MERLEISDQGLSFVYDVKSTDLSRHTRTDIKFSFGIQKPKQIEVNDVFLIKVIMPPAGNGNKEIRIYSARLETIETEIVTVWPSNLKINSHDVSFRVLNELVVCVK